MADAYMTSSNQSAFIPEMWAAFALGIFHENAVMARLVNRDFEETIARKGDTVNVGERGILTAKDKEAGSPIELQAPAGSKHSLVLNKHKDVSFLVEDVTEAQSAVKNMIGYMDDGVKVISAAVDTDLCALYASLSQSVTKDGSIDEATVLAARRKLNHNQIPYKNRYLVLDDSQDQAMLQIDRFTSAEKIGIAGIIVEGAIGRIHGFDVLTDPRIVIAGTSPQQAHGLAFHRNAFCLATRPLELPPAGMGATGIYMEQDGVVIRLLYGYNMTYKGVQCSIDILYGCIVLRDKCGVDVITTYSE